MFRDYKGFEVSGFGVSGARESKTMGPKDPRIRYLLLRM